MQVYLAAVNGKMPISDWCELMDFCIGSHREVRKEHIKECYGDVDLYLSTPHTGWETDRHPSTDCVVNKIDKEVMDLYLAGSNAENITKGDRAGCYAVNRLYILESFYYVTDWMLPYIDNKVWNFMLDSGAFTFMEQKAQGVKATIDSDSMRWDDYVRRYADFIIEHDIDLFFELDIDVVVGLDRVNKLRDALETQTGKRSIPVWHKSRGLENWKQLVKDYEYVAIGGIVSGEIKRHEHKFLHAMCDIAHAERTRVHGLGVSPMGMGLDHYRFDSVDSTNWTMGNRAGHVFYFDGRGIAKRLKPEGTKIKARDAAKHNFREWVKYQRYMKHAGWRMET